MSWNTVRLETWYVYEVSGDNNNYLLSRSISGTGFFKGYYQKKLYRCLINYLQRIESYIADDYIIKKSIC